MRESEGMRLALVLASIVAIPVTEIRAGDPAKKATKQLNADLKEAQQGLAATIVLLNKQLDAQLDLVDSEIKDDSFFLSEAASIFGAAETYQSGLGDALDAAGTDLFFARSAVQSILDAAGIGPADVPHGFGFGDGGMVDDYVDDVVTAARKAVDSAEKRIRKTGALLRKHTDMTLEVGLDLPRNLLVYPGSSGSTFTPLQHTIAILLSISLHDGSNQNRLYCYGRCYSSDTLILDSVSTPSSNLSTTVTVGANNWSRIYADVPRGDFVFKLNHMGKTGGGAYGAISVR